MTDNLSLFVFYMIGVLFLPAVVHLILIHAHVLGATVSQQVLLHLYFHHLHPELIVCSFFHSFILHFLLLNHYLLTTLDVESTCRLLHLTALQVVDLSTIRVIRATRVLNTTRLVVEAEAEECAGIASVIL